MKNTKQLLIKRAKMLALARQFFSERKIIEVDCPCLISHPNLDEHIDVFQLQTKPNRFLHTSPEYAMKRLLAKAAPDIYQLSHVYRKEEKGPLHNPEFTLVEWYRKNVSFSFFLQETIEFIRLFIGNFPYEKISYRNAFIRYANIDYVKATIKDFRKVLLEKKIDFASKTSLDKESYMHLIFSHIIEPNLPSQKIIVIDNFPSSQAALAQIKQQEDEEIAERFEIFFQNIELANGYHELTDAKEQRKRFEKSLKKKKGKFSLDEKFLQALEKGLGDCFGVAVGFDRLFMLHLGEKTIHEGLLFSWDDL